MDTGPVANFCWGPIVTPLVVVLAVVGLEVTTEYITTGTGIRRDGGRRFQILGAATLKLWVPSFERTKGAERRSVSRTSGMAGVHGRT